MFFGFNKWNDISTVDHKLNDAIIFDASLSQSILFNPLDKKSFIFGAGILENIYYIYSRGNRFQIGFTMYFGIKL